ncbi:MAG: hypothetical protein P8P56_05670 [Yoonia sp.]|nr:hypothetical protein [Yoonia sp.]
MITPVGSITKARRFHWRAFVLSAALYIFGLVATVYGADNDVVTYIGFALIAVGAIALATAIVDMAAALFTDLRIAVVLAVIGAVAYAIWANLSPTV